MPGQYDQMVIDTLWQLLQYMVQDLQAGRPIDFYWALEIIQILQDDGGMITWTGPFHYCRRFVLRKAREHHIMPMF